MAPFQCSAHILIIIIIIQFPRLIHKEGGMDFIFYSSDYDIDLAIVPNLKLKVLNKFSLCVWGREGGGGSYLGRIWYSGKNEHKIFTTQARSYITDSLSHTTFVETSQFNLTVLSTISVSVFITGSLCQCQLHTSQ